MESEEVAMRYSTTHTYPFPPDQVIGALTDIDAVRAKYEALGHSDIELLSRDERDGGVSVTTKRIVPLEGIPSFAKKVLPSRNTVTQTDTWQAPDAKGVRHGTFTVEAKGVPVKISGTMRLSPKGDGSEETIDVQVDCKVPLIGGKIADFVGGDTKKAVDHEGPFTEQYLKAQQ